ncbi:hypothetical protein NT01EI_2399 [Edwardsiella ictaluri 93-146]|uniref:Uncharacterized protein n=1 Tax=Edwardsiella ictaluri (strain 93-146) TaxID=634503 RepID=C5BA89_EDWI9|nr:hypothetical protein NT01EI_2399 [Edwardsiella ictaluri 93-146]
MDRDFFIGATSVQERVYHAGMLFLHGAGFSGRVNINTAPGCVRRFLRWIEGSSALTVD